MPLLYGDSTPFPLGYNFLATLEVFLTTATRIVQLESDARELTRKTEKLGEGRVKGLEALDQFHTVVMRAVQDTAEKVQHAHALDYAQRVAEFASRFVEEHKRATVSANEREAAQCRSENERRIQEQRQQLEVFLKAARLSVVRTSIAMQLVGDTKDARHEMSAVFDHPEGIQTVFNLGVHRVDAWTVPRKVSDFAQGVELLVGVDKSWLRGTVTPKQVNVDDWILTSFNLAEDAFTLTLRRKLAEKESLHFVLERTDVGLAGTVEHPGLVGLEAPEAPRLLDAGDLEALDRVWQALRLVCREAASHKEHLVSASLDGTPVFEGGLVIPVVVRLVTMFAPTVREITKRSPNEHELSLKLESEGGRREELYLRKEQLLSKLQPLSSMGREVFAPLGLDTWVPGLTNPPPSVVSSRGGAVSKSLISQTGPVSAPPLPPSKRSAD